MAKDVKDCRLNVRLSEESLAFLKDEAIREGVSLNALISGYVSEHMNGSGPASEADRHIVGLIEDACATLSSQGADSRALRNLKECADILKARLS